MAGDITASYQAWTIGPGQPLEPIAGGTGVSNDNDNTLTLNAPLVVTGSGTVTITAPLSGTATFTAAAVSGCTSPSIIAGTQFIDAVSTAVGSKVNAVMSFTLTATETTAVFDITVPTATTANFANTAQANGVAVVTSGTSGGSLSSLASVAATKTVRVTLTLGTNSGTYTGNLSFSYFVN